MSSDRKRVQFRAPPRLIERADALAAVLREDRTDVLVAALREYLQDVSQDDALTHEIEAAYFADELEFEMLVRLIGSETAQRLRILKADLEDEPLDISDPEDGSEGANRPADPGSDADER